jgi:hypothetical protein
MFFGRRLSGRRGWGKALEFGIGVVGWEVGKLGRSVGLVCVFGRVRVIVVFFVVFAQCDPMMFECPSRPSFKIHFPRVPAGPTTPRLRARLHQTETSRLDSVIRDVLYLHAMCLFVHHQAQLFTRV